MVSDHYIDTIGAELKEAMDRGVIGESEYDLAREAELQARETVEQLAAQITKTTSQLSISEQALQVAAINLERAVLEQERAIIRAPISGVVIL